MIIFLTFLIGFCGGLRSLTAPAATAWAVYFGRLKLEGPLSLIGSLPAVAIFTVIAFAELVVDKLPQSPSRTAPAGLIARIVMGGLTGACVASAGAKSISLGALIGAIGGIAGCFLGYRARIGAVKTLNTRDLNIALVEDLIAIAGSIAVLSHF